MVSAPDPTALWKTCKGPESESRVERLNQVRPKSFAGSWPQEINLLFSRDRKADARMTSPAKRAAREPGDAVAA